MWNKLFLLLIVICIWGGWHQYNKPIPPNPHPAPTVIVPTPEPVVEPAPLPKNQETAPKEEAKPEIVVAPKKDKAPIRYDKNVERPGGFYDYCDKYPTKPECGGR